MGAFFKPVRRKIGVITLVLACLFAAGWVRSLLYAEAFTVVGTYDVFISRARIESSSGAIYFAHFRILDLLDSRYKRSVPRYSVLDAGRARPPIDAKWTYLGIAIKLNSTGSVGGIGVRYWSIVIPLTVLTGGLLFSNPRESINNRRHLESTLTDQH